MSTYTKKQFTASYKVSFASREMMAFVGLTTVLQKTYAVTTVEQSHISPDTY